MVEASGIVDVQRQAWQMKDIGITPNFEIKAVSDAGFVYVALHKEQVIGFIYGYHHFPDIHYSHMMAVLPEFQGHNVGFLLKKFHREEALRSQFPVNSIQWTVDPLLPNNAYLNFAKLGCYCDVYKVNYYGDPSGDGVEIYAGVPTDRFKVVWPIKSPRAKQRMHNLKQDRVNTSTLLQRSPVINDIVELQYRPRDGKISTSFCVEVPQDYQTIRQFHQQTALDWRITFRDICLKYFSQGYKVIDYHSQVDAGERKNYYEFSTQTNDIL